MNALHRTGLGLAMALAASCAPAAAGGPDASSKVVVEVQNNYATAVSRDVFIVGETGTPQRVGSVPAAATRRLDVRNLDPTRQHRLVAESLTGDVITSEWFVIDLGARVSWNLASNRIRVTSP